jgi:hypothetical protein
MIFGVASNAVAVFYIVKQLPLKFTGDQLSVDGGSKVGALKTGR